MAWQRCSRGPLRWWKSPCEALSWVPARANGGISVYRHVVPGLYPAVTLNHSGGLLLRWFRDACCRREIEQARLTGRDAYSLILGGDHAGQGRGPGGSGG
jgi:hypothetical protein